MKNLPDGWKIKELKEVAEIVTGSTPSKLDDEFFNGPFKWVKPGDLADSVYKIEKTEETLSEKGLKECRVLPKGSVLVTCIGTLGKVGLAKEKLASNQQINSLIFKDEILPEYGYFFCKLLKPILENMAPSTTVPIVNKTRFSSLKIYYPPLPQQIKIASILEKADTLRQKRKQANEKLDSFLQSVFLDMFGDPVSNPKGWEKRYIKDIGKVVTGSTPSREIKDYYGNFIEWIKSDNINTPFHYLTQAEEYLSEKGSKIGRVVPKNSILVTCIAGSFDCIGNVAITDREVSFNQQINALIPNEPDSLFFIYGQILIGKKLIQLSSTNSMKGMVSKSNFEKIEIIYPPIELQVKFKEFFENILYLESKSRESQTKLDNLFNSLMQKAFSGELEMADNIAEEIKQSEEQLSLF